MLYCHVTHEDFVQVLAALPEPPAVVRAYLLGAFGILVSSDDLQTWWDAMWRRPIRPSLPVAAKAVAQLIISKGGKRVLSLIRAHANGRDPVVRADDPKLALARLLFDDTMEQFLVDQLVLRSIVCEYYEETQLVEEEEVWLDEDTPEEVKLPEDEEAGADGFDVMDLLSGKPRPSAQ